jgi:hypothetical protein
MIINPGFLCNRIEDVTVELDSMGQWRSSGPYNVPLNSRIGK